MNSYLQLKNISKNFNIDKKIKVLKNLSYDFHKGKVYALMGPSGSGKSTLLNLISLIDRPSLGSVKFSDNQINFNNKKKFRRLNFGALKLVQRMGPFFQKCRYYQQMEKK